MLELQRAIVADPDSDGPRLALADWLDDNAEAVRWCSGEHSHPGKIGFNHGVWHDTDPHRPHHHCDDKCWVSDGRQERAEFIRLQIEIAKLTGPVVDRLLGRKKGSVRDHLAVRHAELHNREYVLLAEFGVRWAAGLPGVEESPAVFPSGAIWCGPNSGFGYHFERGFVQEVCLPLSVFMEHASSLASRHPLTAVTLSDGMSYPNRRGYAWFDRNRSRPSSAVAELPTVLFNALTGWQFGGARHKTYSTSHAANEALSGACVRYARSLV